MSGVYIASRASIPERAAAWRKLREQGSPIISSWIDKAGENEVTDFGELWKRITREVSEADALVLYAEPDDFPLKGALVEVGIAIGNSVPILVVAPGVVINGSTMRPFGSWLKHPLVRQVATVEYALHLVRTL